MVTIKEALELKSWFDEYIIDLEKEYFLSNYMDQYRECSSDLSFMYIMISCKDGDVIKTFYKLLIDITSCARNEDKALVEKHGVGIYGIGIFLIPILQSVIDKVKILNKFISKSTIIYKSDREIAVPEILAKYLFKSERGVIVETKTSIKDSEEEEKEIVFNVNKESIDSSINNDGSRFGGLRSSDEILVLKELPKHATLWGENEGSFCQIDLSGLDSNEID